jgi:guanine deaminase
VDLRDTSIGNRTEPKPAWAVVGTAYHAPDLSGLEVLEVLEDTVVAVDADGWIVEVAPRRSPVGERVLAATTNVVRLGDGERLLPGLVDLHVHAPQWPQLGTGLDLPLERWLLERTFPLEARYADAAFAREVYGQLVPTLLAHGTTTAVYFSSTHIDATTELASQCMSAGQRAFVGRVAMDHPTGTPPWYRDADAATGVAASLESIEAIRAIGGAGADALVQPVITPRFIPACSDDLLRGLGELARATAVRVQTHCSESDWEHTYVLDRYGLTDTSALARFGLLRAHTILAHGDHLTDPDLSMIAGAGAAVAHCPLSNAYFANAVFGVRRAHRLGARVGLGSDVAGGAAPGLLPQCATAVTVSRMLEDGVDASLPAIERGVAGSRIDTALAFHLATAGGADALGIPVGRFTVGHRFDAFVVDTTASVSGLRRWDGVDDDGRLFEKIVRLAGPRDITAVWVSGRRVLTASMTGRRGGDGTHAR